MAQIAALAEKNNEVSNIDMNEKSEIDGIECMKALGL